VDLSTAGAAAVVAGAELALGAELVTGALEVIAAEADWPAVLDGPAAAGELVAVVDADAPAKPSFGNTVKASAPMMSATIPKAISGPRPRLTGSTELRWTPWRDEFSGTLSNSSRGY
jgi:hypothetical protein